MTRYLPPNLLALFAPRDALPFLPPTDKPAGYRKLPYTGVADFLKHFETGPAPPPPPPAETPAERRERKRRERAEMNEYKIEQALALWDPNTNEASTSDPFKTLFVGRLSYDTSESKLRREFEQFGKVKQIKLVMDKKANKPRGYAFLEFEHERDMFEALRKLNGKKLDDRRIVVDVERGRTVRGWRPRRLGGGIDGRLTKAKKTGQGDRRADAPRERSRSRSPIARRPRSRSRSRDRDRERRRSRSRDRDRDRRDRERDRGARRGSRERADGAVRDRSDRDRKDRDRGDRRDRSDRRDFGAPPKVASNYPAFGYEYEDGEYYE